MCFGTTPPNDVRDSFANGAQLFYQSIYRTDAGEPAFHTWTVPGRSLMRIVYHDRTQFWIDLDGGKVWAEWDEKSSFEDTVSYLLGPVFGFVLRMRGVVCLHASAVVCVGRAAAFVGDAGAGKSTTAAALAQRGHSVISDDIVALTERDGGFYAAPAYPYLSLWPESVDALYGPEASLPAFSESFQKRMLSLREGQFASEPFPLGAIFFLDERVAVPDAPRIEKMTQRDALMMLVANTYANLLLDDERRAREFAFLGRMVERVPVWRVRAHQDTSRLGALCGLIEGELSGSNHTPAPIAAPL